MSQSIPALELPVQVFVVGTAIGMTIALIRHHLAGDLDRWPLTVAYYAVPAFWIALLYAVAAEVF